MLDGDVVAIPRLPCGVAREAQRARHSFIKNGFLFHTDDVLEKWLRDDDAMRQFEACVRSVCRDVAAYSGGRLIDRLKPLESLSSAQRTRLAAALDRAFSQTFEPDERGMRMTGLLDRLLGHICELRSPMDAVEKARKLDSIRASARELANALRQLPDGFWLPRMLVM